MDFHSLARKDLQTLCKKNKIRANASRMTMAGALKSLKSIDWDEEIKQKLILRKLASDHNSSVWPLHADLTIKVFCMLDTQSVCCAAATCLMFSKCASDPRCYANIDLTKSPGRVSGNGVATLIKRAKKNLQSMKLGKLRKGKEIYNIYQFTETCLDALEWDEGAAGLLLRRLYLYNVSIGGDYSGLYSALSVCRCLVELEIFGLHVRLNVILRTVFEHCHLIERFSLDSNFFGDILTLKDSVLENLVKMCPRLSSLALRGYRILDKLVSAIIKGAGGLKSLDLSGCLYFSGIFLRDICNGGAANSLETLIVRDCEDLAAERVSRFLSAVFYGDRKGLRYVDVSNSQGLLWGWGVPSSPTPRRCAIDVSQISQERPDIHLIAEYPPVLRLYPLSQSHPPLTSSPLPSSSSDASLSSSDDEY